MVLVGNKVDLANDPERQNQVARVDGSRMADELGVPFFETSAKTGVNVNDALNKLVDDIVEKMLEAAQTGGSFPATEGSGIGLKPEEPKASESTCSC